MYRSRLADKRLLLVLDDVTSEEQVLPLLPGSPSCAVIVTSRARLAGCRARTGSTSTRSTTRPRWSCSPRSSAADGCGPSRTAAAELVKYCGGLPLALRIAGARLASRPQWRIAELARRLKNEVRRLDELSHRGLELRSSIGLTYRSLPEQAQRLFRLFALVQAPDFPGWAAAALLDTDLAEAEDVLERLVDAQMLDTVAVARTGRIRYRFHDLIRVYAQERLMETETAERAQRRARPGARRLARARRGRRTARSTAATSRSCTAPRRGWHLAEWRGRSTSIG